MRINTEKTDNLPSVLWQILRNDEKRPHIMQAADRLEISYSSLASFLRAATQYPDWIKDESLSTRLEHHFPEGWKNYREDFSRLLEFHLAKENVAAPLTPSEEWKMAVKNVMELTARLHGKDLHSFREDISKEPLRKVWDRTSSANPDVTIAAYKKTLTLIFKLCDPEKFPDGQRAEIATNLRGMASTLQNIMPEFR